MLAKNVAAAITIIVLIPAHVLAPCASDGGTGTDADYATMDLGGDGGGVWNITNSLQESPASGAFQFTNGTLQGLPLLHISDPTRPY